MDSPETEYQWKQVSFEEDLKITIDLNISPKVLSRVQDNLVSSVQEHLESPDSTYFVQDLRTREGRKKIRSLQSDLNDYWKTKIEEDDDIQSLTLPQVWYEPPRMCKRGGLKLDQAIADTRLKISLYKALEIVLRENFYRATAERARGVQIDEGNMHEYFYRPGGGVVVPTIGEISIAFFLVEKIIIMLTDNRKVYKRWREDVDNGVLLQLRDSRRHGTWMISAENRVGDFKRDDIEESESASEA